MKLVEALEALKHNPPLEAPVLEVQLACGFTPLHFATFLAAHLRREFPEHRVAVRTGVFGDLPGNLERLANAESATLVTLIEWQDLDPRLGIRMLGGWAPGQLNDIVQTVRDQASRVLSVIDTIRHKHTVVVSLPTLPLPPVAFTPGCLGSRLEWEIHSVLAMIYSKLADIPAVRVVSSQRIDRLSPHAERFDAKSELNAGFPYSLNHADKLAGVISTLVRNPVPMKGLITDLDNTLWSGILGEVSPQGISWDLDHHTQKHGLYQQLLASLAESGTLVGVASKNDLALVEETFRSRKLFLGRDNIFPLEVNWGPKSDSVSRILKTWNISADSVVFVDDSPLELAEVKAAYPDIEVLLFPKDDDKAAYELLYQLRDRFGKSSVSAEDSIRLESIRGAHIVAEATRAEGYSPERFLQQANGLLTLSFVKSPPDPRALELLNKTNQFNLNGKRHSEGSWQQYLNDPNVFLVLAAYEDKYGPLGKIAVLTGRVEGRSLAVDHWVMSCRAFSRRIEHGCLLRIFHRFGIEQASFDFVETQRNQPIGTFLSELIGDASPGSYSITREQLFSICPPVYLQIQECEG